MRRALLALAIGLISMNASAQVAPERAREIAGSLLDHLDRGEFAQAEAMFDEAMRAAVPQDKLAAVWQSLSPPKARGDMAISTQGTVQVTRTPLDRAEGKLVATIAIAADGRVAGLLVQPPGAEPTPAPPVPADAHYDERDTTVGDGERALPATLALPKGQGPFPAVVLVHGSGAHDRDETIGPNRPFLDIARGLAAQGIAVLRYEKRTHARPQDYADGVDIDSETTDDALLAVARLRQTPGIDASRIFVLGHSQGGMMAPRIGMRDPAIAGLILFAAPARNLLDILVEQNDRLLTMQGQRESDAGIAHMQRLEAQVGAIRGDGDVATTGTPLNQSAAYWRSVDAVDPLAEARKSTQPLLVLHGGHDIQVVDADWQGWRRAFGNDPRATLKAYPTLNHLGMASAAGAGLESYEQPGHVDAALISDIAAWIRARG